MFQVSLWNPMKQAHVLAYKWLVCNVPPIPQLDWECLENKACVLVILVSLEWLNIFGV